MKLQGINDVIDGRWSITTVSGQTNHNLINVEFFLRENRWNEELVLSFLNGKLVDSILVVRFGYLDVDQLFEDNTYVRMNLIDERIFTMCWADIDKKGIEN